MRANVGVDCIRIDKVLYDFIGNEAIPGTGIEEKSRARVFANGRSSTGHCWAHSDA